MDATFVTGVLSACVWLVVTLLSIRARRVLGWWLALACAIQVLSMVMIAHSTGAPWRDDGQFLAVWTPDSLRASDRMKHLPIGAVVMMAGWQGEPLAGWEPFGGDAAWDGSKLAIGKLTRLAFQLLPEEDYPSGEALRVKLLVKQQ